MFKRKDVHFDPVDKRMCKDIRSAASRYTSKLRENQKKRAERLEAYGSVKSVPATLAKEKVQRHRELSIQRRREKSSEESTGNPCLEKEESSQD
ncbi:uncharacterized protein LOC143245026 isoform X2 [Tachypleus tridentatus]|uniref:uncharacterized protein LOC143245026 isoform X2 n=1 Tax=Tachypleus tridentatus TaxID=6853 RepID=UPI003FD190A6